MTEAIVERRERKVGYTADGRRLILIGERRAGAGQPVIWSLRAEPRTFREAPVTISGLSAKALQDIAEFLTGEPS